MLRTLALLCVAGASEARRTPAPAPPPDSSHVLIGTLAAVVLAAFLTLALFLRTKWPTWMKSATHAAFGLVDVDGCATSCSTTPPAQPRGADLAVLGLYAAWPLL